MAAILKKLEQLQLLPFEEIIPKTSQRSKKSENTKNDKNAENIEKEKTLLPSYENSFYAANSLKELIIFKGNRSLIDFFHYLLEQCEKQSLSSLNQTPPFVGHIQAEHGFGKSFLLRTFFKDLKLHSKNKKIAFESGPSLAHLLGKGVFNWENYHILLIDDWHEILGSKMLEAEFAYLLEHFLLTPGKFCFLSSHQKENSDFSSSKLKQFFVSPTLLNFSLEGVLEEELSSFCFNILEKSSYRFLFSNINNNLNFSEKEQDIAKKIKDFFPSLKTKRTYAPRDILSCFRHFCFPFSFMPKKEETLSHSYSRPSLDSIKEDVAKYCNLDSKELITSSSRQKEIVLARNLCIFLYFFYHERNYEKTAKTFQKDRTTILHSLQQIQKQRQENSAIDLFLKKQCLILD